MVRRQTPPGRGSSVASMPIHSTIFTGSVKYENTVSGEAATRTSCSRTSVAAGASGTAPPLLGLGRTLEARQPGRDHVGEEAMEVGEALGSHAVEPPRPVAALADQARLLEDREVLRDRRLRDGEARGDLPGASLSLCQQAQDLPALRLGDRLE